MSGALPTHADGFVLVVLGKVGVLAKSEFSSAGGPKQRALLALLASRGQRSVTASEIAESLWGASPPANERASIQVVVSRLRSFLKPFGADIVLTGISYGLDLGASLVVDLDLFERQDSNARQCKSDREHAAAVAAADAGLGLWSGQPFEDLEDLQGIRPELLRLQETKLALVELAASCELHLGQLGSVVTRLTPHLVDHPGREAATADLMLGLYRAGRQVEALARFSTLRDYLVQSSGLEPGPALRQLELDMLQQNPTLDAASQPTVTRFQARIDAQGQPRPGIDPAPSFVGRHEDEELLREALLGRRHVSVVGVAGTGKSTLVARLANAVVGSCVQLTGTPPLWPWPSLLGEIQQTMLGAALDDSVVAAARSTMDEPQEEGVFAISLAIVEALRAARGIVGAIVIEDIHWADPGAHQLLKFVMSELDEGPSIVTTSRTHSPDVAANAQVLEIGPLSDDAVGSLLSARLGMPVSASVLSSVMAATGGVALLVDRAAACVAEGKPFEFRERDAMLQDWLVAVNAEEREVMDVASLVGESFEVSVVLGVLQSSGTLRHLDRCIEQGLLTEGPGVGRLSFRHALLRIALLEAISPGRRASLHSDIASELISRPDAVHRSSEIAEQLAAAHLVAPAQTVLEYALRAAGEARDLGAHAEAMRFLQSAVHAAERVDLQVEDRVRLSRTAGRVLWLGGDNAGARDHFADAATLLVNDDPQLAEVAADYAGFGLASVEIDDRGFALLDRALAAPTNESSDAARLRCRTRQVIGGWDDATIDSAAANLYAEAHEAGDRKALTWALGALLVASMTMQGAPIRLERSLDMIAVGEEAGSDSAIGLGLVHRADALAEHGRFGELAPILGRIQQLADATSRPAHRWYDLHYSAALLVAQGEFERGEERLGQALTAGQETHQTMSFEAYSASLFTSRYAQGQSGELLSLVDLETAPSRMSELGLNAWHLGIGLCLLDDGQIGAARERLDSVMSSIDTVVRRRVRSIELAQLIDLAIGLGDREAAALGRDWLLEHSGRCCVAAGMTIVGAADMYLGLAELMLGNDQSGRRLLDLGDAQNRAWGLHAWEHHGRQRLGLLDSR